MLLLILIGVFEASRAIGLDRRFSLVTAMTGDLVAREQDMGANPKRTVEKIMEIIDHVMGDGQGSALEVEIIPVMGFGKDGHDTRTYAPSYKRTRDGTVSVSGMGRSASQDPVAIPIKCLKVLSELGIASSSLKRRTFTGRWYSPIPYSRR
jgi:hypothetical protein